jgi:hypothetical protein
MSISVGTDRDMPRRDRAQVELRRLPLLRNANRGLALDRFADLTRGMRDGLRKTPASRPGNTFVLENLNHDAAIFCLSVRSTV